MKKDYVSSKERIESNIEKFNSIIKRDSLYLALAVTLIVIYILSISYNLGA